MTNQQLKHQELILFLAESFRAHHIECQIKDSILIFQNQCMTADALLIDKTSSSTILYQLDVKLEIGLGREIIESCVGFGETEELAFAEAKKNFLQNSFHVLLSAFFTAEFDNEVSKSEWLVGGQMYDVTMSNIAVRGKRLDPFPTKWLDQFEEMIKQEQLNEGIHWMRLYYAQSENKMMVSEILFDNDVWESKVSAVGSFDYPKDDSFYSVRIFLTLRRGIDISRAAAAMAWMQEEDEDKKIEQLLLDEGWSLSDIEKARAFIPLAFGRVLLNKNASPQFSDTAIITDESDNEFEIKLQSERIYTAAYQLAEHIMREGCVNLDHFKYLCTQSSELRAYNQALLDGAKPEELEGGKFGQPMIYLSLYQKDSDVMESIKEKSKIDNVPFWQFWKK